MIRSHESATGTRRIRVWLDEFPSAIIEEGIVIEKRFPAIQQSLTFSKVTCELNFLAGKGQYALLGCHVIPRESESVVRIFETGYKGPIFEDSLERYETVRVGLPKEYIDGVLAGLNSVQPLPAADIEFRCAAHGEISSSQIAFAWAVNLLGRILHMSPTEINDGTLSELLSGDSFRQISFHA
jgi:hypothetical protein